MANQQRPSQGIPQKRRTDTFEQTVAVQLAANVAALDVLSLPVDVSTKARDCLLDSVSCMLGGTVVTEVRRAVDLVLRWGQGGKTRVPGFPGGYSTPFAAYAAAQFANALDYDDTVLGVGHPGAAVIATALTLGQAEKSSGHELTRALVAGYEVAIRVGRATAPSEKQAARVRGHSWAVFGAAATAAALLRLNAEQTADAFGLAGQHALVPFVGKWYERPISSLKNNYGWATMGGIMAASLAAEGVRGNRQIFDGESGFWAMAASDRWDPNIALAGLGADFAILDVGFKPFAACRYTHSALEAVEMISRRHSLSPSAITRVVVRAAERATVFADYHPQTLLDAQFSLPYAVAGTLMGRPLTVFDPRDQEVAALAQRVEIQTDLSDEGHPRVAGLPARVEIVLRDGRCLSERSDVPPGDPARPLSATCRRTKFLSLAEPVLGPTRAEHCYRMIACRSELPPATEVAELFAAEEWLESRLGPA